MAYLLAEEHGLNNHLMLCPYACSPSENVVRVWTKDLLRPAVLYIDDSGLPLSMFGGLLFEADRTLAGEQLSARSMGLGVPAPFSSWISALEMLFEPDKNVWAALELSKERPDTRVLDIWIALPYPFESAAGSGVFQNTDDKIAALKCLVTELKQKWHAASRKVPGNRARLCGFAWMKSFLAPGDDIVIQSISQHVHDLELKLMWCCNFGTTRAWDYAELGFDLAFSRPTYTGMEPRGIPWIRNTADFASRYHMGMAIWGEQRTSSHQTLDFLKTGVELFRNAFQIYDLPFKAVYEWYANHDPMYSYLYVYMTGAFRQDPDKGLES